MKRASAHGLARIVCCLCAVGAARAGSIGLAWSATPGAAGYRVYYGTSSGNYSGSKNVGSATSTSLDGLADCTSWYVAVKAYNSAGESEQYSTELAGWPHPSIEAPVPAGGMQGDQRMELEIQGANFRPGATVAINNPRVRLGPPLVRHCGRITVEASIDPEGWGQRPAQTGRFTLTVLNPDGTFGERGEGFEVQVDPARFDVNRSTEATRGRLDGADTVWLARLFASQEGHSALYDADFDFDGDGWIGGEDLALLGVNFGECWSGTDWTAEACESRR